MNILKIIDKILPPPREAAPRPPIPSEDGKLLLDEHGTLRINFDHPEVRAKILHQLKTYPRISAKEPAE